MIPALAIICLLFISTTAVEGKADVESHKGASPGVTKGNTTAAGFYFGNATLVEKELKDVLDQEVQPPWSMLPLSTCLTCIGTFAFMGFDIKFKKAGTSKALIHLISIFTAGPFILLALNGWRRDIKEFMAIDSDDVDGNQLVVGLLRLAVWATSSNLFKAMTIWGGFFLQSPAAALDLKPKYNALCGPAAFPMNPFGTSWLPVGKWFLAVVLFPYLFPLMFMTFLVPIAFAVVGVVGYIAFLCYECFNCCVWCVQCGLCIAIKRCFQWIFGCGPCKAFWSMIMESCMCLKWVIFCGPCLVIYHCSVALVCSFVFAVALWGLQSDDAVDKYNFWIDKLFGRSPIFAAIFGIGVFFLWCQFVIVACARFYSCLFWLSNAEYNLAHDWQSLGTTNLLAKFVEVFMAQYAGIPLDFVLDKETPFMTQIWTMLINVPKPLRLSRETKRAIFDMNNEFYDLDFHPYIPLPEDSQDGTEKILQLMLEKQGMPNITPAMTKIQPMVQDQSDPELAQQQDSLKDDANARNFKIAKVACVLSSLSFIKYVIIVQIFLLCALEFTMTKHENPVPPLVQLRTWHTFIVTLRDTALDTRESTLNYVDIVWNTL